jgi:hypothetical protein
MKTKIVKPNTSLVPKPLSFRRFVRNMFACFLKRQQCDCENGLQTALEELHDLKDSIEIVAREIARQAKRSK